MSEQGRLPTQRGRSEGAPADERERYLHDHWREVQNTAGANPGGVAVWVVCMLLLLAGFVLMGAAF